MRRVEFVGLPSPFAFPEVQQALAAPIRSIGDRHERRAMRAELTRQERRRQMQGFARVPGRTQLTLGQEHGLTQMYVWGPRDFIVEMPLEDVDRLFKLHTHHALAFRVVPDVVVMRS